MTQYFKLATKKKERFQFNKEKLTTLFFFFVKLWTHLLAFLIHDHSWLNVLRNSSFLLSCRNKTDFCFLISPHENIWFLVSFLCVWIFHGRKWFTYQSQAHSICIFPKTIYKQWSGCKQPWKPAQEAGMVSSDLVAKWQTNTTPKSLSSSCFLVC